MKQLSIFLLCSIATSYAHSALFDVFKDDAGRTKWQHVANFSGSVLIVLLLITLISLLVSRFRIRQRNKELHEIKLNLEDTVRQRTEKLQESNKQLESSRVYLKSILTSMPSMLIGLNRQMEITHWNKTAETIAGKLEQDVVGLTLWEAYPTITVAPEQISKVLANGKPDIIKHSQRGQYYFDITIYPLNIENAGVVIIIENVTQRSLAENMLIQRDKMASMGELASTMAHDINSPLRRILYDVEAAHNHLDALPSVPKELIAVLKDAVIRGKQASAVVDNLLDFSGSSNSEKQESDIGVIIDHCLELAEDVISVPNGLHFREIHIKKDIAADVAPLPCYAAELQQVFLSLFRHACHAIAEKNVEDGYKPAINIEIFDAYDALWIKVQHNGKGLSTDEQQNIFEPIVQYTTPAQPKPLYLQNRLSFSYFIVTEHHHGEMAVTSDPEVGTTFHIQFNRV